MYIQRYSIKLDSCLKYSYINKNSFIKRNNPIKNKTCENFTIWQLCNKVYLSNLSFKWNKGD